MTNDEIMAVITGYLVEICEVDPNAVTRERSMRDLGADSLDIVEVVSCSMRTIGVQIPRVELGELKDIGSLADRLESAWNAKHAQV